QRAAEREHLETVVRRVRDEELRTVRGHVDRMHGRRLPVVEGALRENGGGGEEQGEGHRDDAHRFLRQRAGRPACALARPVTRAKILFLEPRTRLVVPGCDYHLEMAASTI